MFLVHKKGLARTGDTPALLAGYGAFKVRMVPAFSATLLQWFDAGGLFAVPNVRGGGEYGDAWHDAGRLDRKQTAFDDFIAAAEWLIANKYTNAQKLAIHGGSNGGLLTGAAITQRPDLFRAALVLDPLLDMLRYHKFVRGPYWAAEYGSPDDAGQMQVAGGVLAISPRQAGNARTRRCCWRPRKLLPRCTRCTRGRWRPRFRRRRSPTRPCSRFCSGWSATARPTPPRSGRSRSERRRSAPVHHVAAWDAVA